MKVMMDELAKIMKNEVEGSTFIFNVSGTSMIPLLITNDKVKIVKTKSVKKNDIILYQRKDGTYVLHRILKIKNDVFYLCGDNQAKLEYPIYLEDIIGKVISYKKLDNLNNEYYLKNFKYKLYVWIWSNRFIRRVILKFIRPKYMRLEQKNRGKK